MIFKTLLTLFFLVAVFAPKAQAAIPFGTGTYVNLCGSGTAANVYSCNANCNVRTGSCAGSNNGVVKYTCNGRWDQCLESESYWSNYAEVGSTSCGKTVQVSVFDKKCRLENGGWDPSCKLDGYLVWYSGDCQTGFGSTITPAPTQSPMPTSRITPVVSPTVAPRSSPTPTVEPTPGVTGGAAAICNKSCVLDSECQAGFKCLGGQCRNPACSTDTTCFCGGEKVATGSGGKKSPDTGGEEFILIAGVVVLLGMGIYARRVAGKIW